MQCKYRPRSRTDNGAGHSKGTNTNSPAVVCTASNWYRVAENEGNEDDEDKADDEDEEDDAGDGDGKAEDRGEDRSEEEGLHREGETAHAVSGSQSSE